MPHGCLVGKVRPAETQVLYLCDGRGASVVKIEELEPLNTRKKSRPDNSRLRNPALANPARERGTRLRWVATAQCARRTWSFLESAYLAQLQSAICRHAWPSVCPNKVPRTFVSIRSPRDRTLTAIDHSGGIAKKVDLRIKQSTIMSLQLRILCVCYCGSLRVPFAVRRSTLKIFSKDRFHNHFARAS